MCSTDFTLTEITEIPILIELRDLYRDDWPKNCVGYYCLDNFIRWMQRKPDIANLHVYTLNGDWKSDGLFLIVDRYQLFFYSLSSQEKNLALISRALSLLDWSGGLKVSSFLERHRSALLDVVKEKQLTLEYDSFTVMYYMPRKQALDLEVKSPKGFRLSPLSENDAHTIDSLWPNKHCGSLFLIKRLIAWNANMGIYVEDTNELVAWCLRLQAGFLGALQVKESHKRLGLGSVVARATSVCIAKMGHDVMALVHEDNVPSRGMFDKLNFKVIDNCYWLKTNSIEEGYDWPEGQ